jgi:hypothetical protein
MTFAPPGVLSIRLRAASSEGCVSEGLVSLSDLTVTGGRVGTCAGVCDKAHVLSNPAHADATASMQRVLLHGSYGHETEFMMPSREHLCRAKDTATDASPTDRVSGSKQVQRQKRGGPRAPEEEGVISACHSNGTPMGSRAASGASEINCAESSVTTELAVRQNEQNVP